MLNSLRAWWQRRQEAMRRSEFKQRNGDVRCPHCNTWQSAADSKPEFLAFTTGPGQTDFLDCAQCGKQSEWLFGPGIWIGISKKSLEEAQHGQD